MSQYQANLECLEDEDLEICSENQGLEIAQVCKDEEEKFLSSSNPLVPCTLKEAPVAENPSSSEGLQHSCFSSSSSEEGARSQENEQIACTNQAAALPGKVPCDALNEKVVFLVRFMLLKYQMKEPIRRADMLEIIMPEDEALFPTILLQACECMETTFGLDVMEVDPINHCYGVFIKLGLTYDGMQREGSVPKTGLLILLLSVIFVKGNRATEEEVWEALNQIGLYAGEVHFMYGEPREIITREFVQEKYVEYRPVFNSDPPQYEFLWGPRARAETSKMKVLEFMAKVLGTNLWYFPFQFIEAVLEDIERALARISQRAAYGPRFIGR
ncbi:PREDICTED: melanoma-associated antigen B16 [Chinchilla lanigera]|uniref:melanoma-associated antigen B16 n=1 Tax=Chinchilla lanigera TaxID=34839 RepID=UPI0006987E9C|nr:PREDICTED: melanoma-associated antigen B16 [Chinchilla lanigera]